MRLAVIGDYESPTYQEFLERVKIIFPGEQVLDLSRHKAEIWKTLADARMQDIESAHTVIISRDWSSHVDSRVDITRAQALKKECFIEIDGRFLPFPEYAKRW